MPKIKPFEKIPPVKSLVQIQERSADILQNFPKKRAEFVKELEDAEEGCRQAKAALEAAENIESYDSAAEVLKRSEMLVKFARNGLSRLDTAPRMDEAEYFEAVKICRGIMDNAVNSYREKAAALMDQLKALKDEYTDTAEEINLTLVNLDAAANVLQSKYTYKLKHYQGMPDEKEPDSNAWLEYALRYDDHTAYELATDCTEEEREDAPYKRHDSVLNAAWSAVNTAYPRCSY